MHASGQNYVREECGETPGNPLAKVDFSGYTTTFDYDDMNRLESETADPTHPSLALSQAPSVIEHSYDVLNRLTSLVAETPNVGVHSSYAYTLNDAGHRTKVVEATGRATDYAYDKLYRLTAETISGDLSGPTGSVSYAYDLVGNRQSRTSTVSGLSGQSFAYSDNDLLTTDIYDGNGNTTVSEDLTDGSGGDATDVYDYRNRLIRRTKADGSIIDLTYDAAGNRIGKTLFDPSFVILNSTEYLVDANNLTGYAQVVEERRNGGVHLRSRPDQPGPPAARSAEPRPGDHDAELLLVRRPWHRQAARG